MKKLSFLFVAVFSILMIQSCVKDLGLNNSKKAPKLPAPELLTMDFNDFSQKKKDGLNGRSVDNFLHAATNVLVWNTVVTVQLYIPVAALREAFNQKAVYQGNGKWMWSYDVTDNQNKTFIVKLYGELLINDEVKWDMYVSQVGGFTNMHWFTGITGKNNNYASWTLNADPVNPKPFIKIDYNKSGNNALIRYTNVVPGVPQNGGYIEYREAVINGTEFDRAYDVYAADLNNLLQINWNSQVKNGRVKDAKRFNDNEWHCWDSSLQDDDCN
ncbi:MAG: hypothetical protein ACM3PT_12230 [Deltaproteobacteria bacterium]